MLAWLTGGIVSLFVLAYTPAIGAGAYLNRPIQRKDKSGKRVRIKEVCI